MKIDEIAKECCADEKFLMNAVDVMEVETDGRSNELIIIEALYLLCTDMIFQNAENKKKLDTALIDGSFEIKELLEKMDKLLREFRVYQYSFNKEEKKDKGVKEKGFVYIASCATEGVYKIGMSRYISDRERTLKVGNHDLSIFAYTQSNNPRKLEMMLHNIYSKKNLSGEWFELNKEEIEDLIQSFCFTLAIESPTQKNSAVR
jgi:hypothetical protein